MNYQHRSARTFLPQNLLLNALPAKARDYAFPRLLTKPMNVGEVIFEEGAPLIHAVFPHNGVISLQARLHDGRVVEKTSIGREGFVGLNHLLGETRFPCHAEVAIAGTASWLSIEDFDTMLQMDASVRETMLGYSMTVIKRLMQSVVCASVHSANQRVASWLLHAHDRTYGDSFELTQRMLANILGLRLATISDACSRLQDAGAIDYSRGTLRITGRRELELQACECYQAIRVNA